MANMKLFKLSACGTGIMAVCCFTPVLVILFSAVGLSAWLGWLDYVLLPALAIFFILTVIFGVRVYREKRRAGEPS